MGPPGAPATGRGGGEGHKRGVPGVGGVRVRGVDAAVGVFLGAVASFSFFLVVWMSCVSCLLPCLLESSCLDFQAVPSRPPKTVESAIAVQNGQTEWRAGSNK